MLFNSIEFALFLPAVLFFFYWFVFFKHNTAQNILLLIASYIFYGWWDWRFLALIVVSSLTDYIVGIKIFETTKKHFKKRLLGLSVVINIGILGFFKYYDFFAHNLAAVFNTFGFKSDLATLNIVLPVGISFYTFQTLSYTIDVYRNKIQPTYNPLQFFAFVSFFPQLVAGPIERASNLLPQFKEPKKIDLPEIKDGLRQMLWGFFMKMVIADTCAIYVDPVFADSGAYNSFELLTGGVLFAFQIYGDFSGYSHIAIGTARLFGFNLMQNFAVPYFSRDIAEFWRRWHISLSTWFRDYVYIPLGGSFGGRFQHLTNIVVTFTLSGLWHGANWTFVVWGFLNGMLYLPLMLFNKHKANKESLAERKLLPGFKEATQIITTFFITVFAWIIFRSRSIEAAYHYISSMFTPQNFYLTLSEVRKATRDSSIEILAGVIVFSLILEWFQRTKKHALELSSFPWFVRWGLYALVLNLIVFFGVFNKHEFIYFQF